MGSLFIIVFVASVIGVFKPYIGTLKRWHFGLAAFVSLLMVGIFSEPRSSSDDGPVAVASSDGEAASVESSAPGEPVKPESKWTYSRAEDEMRGTESSYAELEGDGPIALDFPYGEQTPQILIRQSPKFGFDILVGVSSGQIQCSEYSGGHLNVKFDDGPIRRFNCSEAADGSNNMVFLDNAKGFLAQLKGSKKAIVEAQFFQNGLQQMKFTTAGLEWPKK